MVISNSVDLVFLHICLHMCGTNIRCKKLGNSKDGGLPRLLSRNVFGTGACLSVEYVLEARGAGPHLEKESSMYILEGLVECEEEER